MDIPGNEKSGNVDKTAVSSLRGKISLSDIETEIRHFVQNKGQKKLEFEYKINFIMWNQNVSPGLKVI